MQRAPVLPPDSRAEPPGGLKFSYAPLHLRIGDFGMQSSQLFAISRISPASEIRALLGEVG
jgi:hypothetical protein